jgi:hypothetical protein
LFAANVILYYIYLKNPHPYNAAEFRIVFPILPLGRYSILASGEVSDGQAKPGEPESVSIYLHETRCEDAL